MIRLAPAGPGEGGAGVAGHAGGLGVVGRGDIGVRPTPDVLLWISGRGGDRPQELACGLGSTSNSRSISASVESGLILVSARSPGKRASMIGKRDEPFALSTAA